MCGGKREVEKLILFFFFLPLLGLELEPKVFGRIPVFSQGQEVEGTG